MIEEQAPATRARKQASVSAFVSWCCEEQLLANEATAEMAEIARVSVRGWLRRSSPGTFGDGHTIAPIQRRLSTRSRVTDRAPGAVAEDDRLLEAAVRILTVLIAIERPCTVAEIAQWVLITERNAHRIATWLCTQRLITRSGEKYVVGDCPGLLSSVDDNVRDELRGIATPYLTELYEHSGGVVSLGTLAGDEVHYLSQLYNHRAPRPKAIRTQRAPAHCTAIGKLLLANRAERHAHPDPLPAMSPWTVRTRLALERQLDDIRKRGFASARQEYVPGLACIAFPVVGRSGDVVAALAVGDEISHLAVDRAVWHARRTAIALSAVLSSHTQPGLLSNVLRDDLYRRWISQLSTAQSRRARSGRYGS